MDGDRLDDSSLVHETLLILVGGDETTRHVMTGGMAALLSHPGQLQQLAADRTLLPGAVEEMLRWVTPIKNMARTTTCDVELSGTTIPAGQELLLLYPSANRDEEVFERPDEFDITRSPNPHVAFGFGAHFCIGAVLARVEGRILLEELLARFGSVAPAGDVVRAASPVIAGVKSAPLVFGAR
jgi:cytochrome P450 family 142 subfamily A polypeptide 1